MANTRVYILAKELNVKSTAIVQKCQDEGLDVKNHMAAISAGLAATIREWFSEGEHTTTVETAERVNLEKVRVKPKRKTKKKPVEEPQAEIVDEPETIAETTPETISETPPEATPETPEISDAETTAPEEIQQEPAPEQPAPSKTKKKETPAKPKPIQPAGPMLTKPTPAKLSGPTIIRVEAVTPDRPRYKPKPRPKNKFKEQITQPLISSDADREQLGISNDDKKKGKHKDRTHGRRKSFSTAEDEKKAKYQTLRRQRDIEERKARLDAAAGERQRVRPTRKVSSKADGSGSHINRPEKATVKEPVSVKNLSAALAVKTSEIISKLMHQGIMATANESIANEAAELLALEYGCELTIEHKITLEQKIKEKLEQTERANLINRPIVATILGHVDHGKTSLLDKIRKSKVTETEAGGITQHTSAYQVKVGENKITFLDTPGHEAFTAMRARGANMTDVVVLVVAADDGVMPQTAEAIAHSKAANVPVIIALNKIDLPGVDINRIFAQLSEKQLTPTEWGGDTDVVKTSAITGEGINDLLEHIDYVREIHEMKADNTIPATGWVVEARMDAQRGAVATVLVKEGLLSKSDVVLAGRTYGKIKNLKDTFGKNIKKATSAMPVEITGLNDVPQAGDRFYCLGKDLSTAKAAAEENLSNSREKTLASRSQITLENLFSQIEAGNVKDLNVIIRADVQGSVDVLTKYLSDLSTEEVKIKILHASPGGITEGDVVLAEASNAIIIGFNVIADERVAKIADTAGVDIRLYTVIYRITEELKKSMSGLLEPEQKETAVGRATVRDIFKVSRLGTIAGCYVNDGFAKKKATVRLIRDNIVIRDDLTMQSLKHFKDDAKEVKAGMECGIKFNKFDDIKIGDMFDFYEIVEVQRTI